MEDCKLCKKEKKLCRSHIIPELYFKNLYGQNPRRLYIVSNLEGKEIKFEQKGLREKLFCRDCEDIFMRYEQEAEKIITNIKSQPYKINELNVLKGIDYKVIKLFQNSILFRASVCTEEFFNSINIGMHENRIRKRLLNNNPGEPHEFPCTMTLLLEDYGICNDMILYPDSTVDSNNHRRYRFVFGGFIWIYFASLFLPPFDFKLFSMNKDGVLKYYSIHRSNVKFIDKYLREVQAAGKFQDLKKYF